MKKILCFVAALAATTFITTTSTSCKFAPDQHDGDTVAASEFYPEDTAAIHAKKTAKMAAVKAGKDSVGIYHLVIASFIGDALIMLKDLGISHPRHQRDDTQDEQNVF